MIKAISFDLDDTLWDARPALLRAEALQYAWLETHAPRIAARHTASSLRAARLDLAQRQPEIAHDFTRLRQVALAECLREHDYPESLAAPAMAVFLRARSQVDFYADALPALRRLAARFTLVALTNGNADLDIAGVAQYFVARISPAEAGVRKPDPRIFLAGLERAGVTPDEAVHVGDEPLYDIEGAHRAAMRSIWLNRDGVAWSPEYAQAHAEIASLADLERAIDGLAPTIGDRHCTA